MSTTVVSAPGKVLLAGGYLVLDPQYSGVVVSTSSRFYTVVASAIHEPPERGKHQIQIRVRSPQFVNATWTYGVSVGGTAVHLEQVVGRFPRIPDDEGRRGRRVCSRMLHGCARRRRYRRGG